MNLNTLTKEELIQMVEDLCDQQDIQRYIEQTYNQNKLRQMKEKIDELFFPKSGMPYISLPQVEGMIGSFEQECVNQEMLVELEIFYMECIIEFTQTYGMMGKDFYNHLLQTYETVIKNDSLLFLDKLEYLEGCMKYMDTEIYKKMIEIRKGQ